jgi:dynactin 4
MCPNCRNTLSVVPSDPPDMDDGRSLAVNLSVVGEPPFFLYCNFCRWDSAEVDITFEKPTGLAGESFLTFSFGEFPSINVSRTHSTITKV